METSNLKHFFKTLYRTKFYAIIIVLTFLYLGYYYSYYHNIPMYSSTAVMVLAKDINTSNITDEADYITRVRCNFK